MPRATTEASAGVTRTRQKAAAAAAAAVTGPSSSSVESHHTTCALTSNAPGSPGGKHDSKRASNASKPCNEQQQPQQRHPGNAHQAARSGMQQQDLFQNLEQPAASQTQQQAAATRASVSRFKLRQGAHTKDQQQRRRPTTRSGYRSATAAASAAGAAERGASAIPQSSSTSAPLTAQLDGPTETSPCRTLRNLTAALIEAAEAADLVACLCSGMTAQCQEAAASWADTAEQEHQPPQQDRHQQQQQQPMNLQHQALQKVPAAAARHRRRSRRLADLNKSSLPTPATAAGAAAHDESADQSSSHLAVYSPPIPADAATAETTLSAVQEAMVSAAALEKHVDTADIPPTSLQARFARLSAEQQLSILLDLELLTHLEEGCKVKQAARRAAVEAREKEKEAARQHKRRSGRLHQVMEGTGNTHAEGGASRSGTPDIAQPSQLQPGVTEAPSSKRMRRFDGLWLPVMTPDCCKHAHISSKYTRSGERTRGGRVTPSPGPGALKHNTLEGAGESRQQHGSGRTESPAAAAVSATTAGAAALHTVAASQRASSMTRRADETNEQGSHTRPSVVQRLGARAQARKGSAASKRAWILCTAPEASGVSALVATRSQQ